VLARASSNVAVGRHIHESKEMEKKLEGGRKVYTEKEHSKTEEKKRKIENVI
jgi:hypothetical protein